MAGMFAWSRAAWCARPRCRKARSPSLSAAARATIPAFAGYVGPGLADAAVAGDVFASPSTAAVARVCRHADQGGGILLGFGNYAGDVLNFGVAAERLARRRHRCAHRAGDRRRRQCAADAAAKRRGIAGDSRCLQDCGRCSGSRPAARRGRAHDAAMPTTAPFPSVSPSKAARCRAPLLRCLPFRSGKMALGLGIHGEPGIQRRRR